MPSRSVAVAGAEVAAGESCISTVATLYQSVTHHFERDQARSKTDFCPYLVRCLSSTDIIESPNSGMRLRTRRVCRWREGSMVLRWAAAALSMTEKHFRKMMGYPDLWMLKAALKENQTIRHKEEA